MGRYADEAKARAEARFEAATKKSQATEEALADHRTQHDAVLSRTAKLKEQRLAKEAAENAAAPAAKKTRSRPAKN